MDSMKKRKNPLSLSGIEPQVLFSPAGSLVTVQTTLHRDMSSVKLRVTFP